MFYNAFASIFVYGLEEQTTRFIQSALRSTPVFSYFFGSISQQSLCAATGAVGAHKKYQKRRIDIPYDADREILLPSSLMDNPG